MKTLSTFLFSLNGGDVNYLQLVCSFSAYFNDIVVGAVCCRVDTSDQQRRLYIMTLGCLAPYRRLGIGNVFIKTFLIQDLLMPMCLFWIQ